MRAQKEDFVTMSLGDHLEELRKRLLLALVGLIITLSVCLGFGKQLMNVIGWPYDRACAYYSTSKSLDKSFFNLWKHDEKNEKDAAKETESQVSPTPTTEEIIVTPKLYIHHPTEKVMIYFKTCILFGIITASPWIFYQVWLFISAGLYPKERKIVYRVLPFSVILFLVGSAFFMSVVAPMMLLFLLKFNIGLTTVDQWRLKDYVNMISILTLLFGLAFQMPLAIIAVVKMGIVSIKNLTSARKYVILGLFVVAAVVTPPDIISQVSLAIPLYLLYESSILICKIMGKKVKD